PVAGVGLETQLAERLDERGLVRRDPLAADLPQLAVDDVGPQPPADAVAGLQDDDAHPGGGQAGCCGEAGDARADDGHVAFEEFHDGSGMPFRDRLLVRLILSRAGHRIGSGVIVYFVVRYSWMPSAPPSRPRPDCLTPPNGAA